LLIALNKNKNMALFNETYSTGRANMAMMPEAINLAKLQTLRQNVDKGEFDLRDLARKEQAAFKEADEFGQYEKFLAENKDVSPAERTRMAFEQNPSWAANRDITASAQATQQVTQAAEMESSFEANKQNLRETARINAENGLNAAIKTKQDFENQVQQGMLDNLSSFGTFLGSSGRVFSTETKKKLMEAGVYMSSDPESQFQFRGLGSVISSFAQAENLLSTYAAEVSQYRPLLEATGVNLDFNQPEEEFQANYAKIKEMVKDPNLAKRFKRPEDIRNILTAASIANKANSLYSRVAASKGEFETDLNGFDYKDPQAAKIFVNQQVMMSSQLGGVVQQEISRKSTALEQEKKQLDLQTKILELKNLQNKPVQENQRIRIAQNKVEVSRELMSMKKADAQFQIFKSLREEKPEGDIGELTKQAQDLYDNLVGSSTMGRSNPPLLPKNQ
jgi:hypothetical protein